MACVSSSPTSQATDGKALATRSDNKAVSTHKAVRHGRCDSSICSCTHSPHRSPRDRSRWGSCRKKMLRCRRWRDRTPLLQVGGPQAPRDGTPRQLGSPRIETSSCCRRGSAGIGRRSRYSRQRSPRMAAKSRWADMTCRSSRCPRRRSPPDMQRTPWRHRLGRSFCGDMGCRSGCPGP